MITQLNPALPADAAIQHIRNQSDHSGVLAYSVTQSQEKYILHFPEQLEISVQPSLPIDHPDFACIQGNDDPTDSSVNHVMKNHVLPMVKSWKGALVLHASSVLFNHECFGFYGASGAGKSTVADLLSHRASFSFWSDDWLELLYLNRHFKTQYFESLVRLDAEHARSIQSHHLPTGTPITEGMFDKMQFRPPHQSTKKLNDLKALFELLPTTAGETLKPRRLNAAEAFRSLSNHLFRLDTKNPEHLRREYVQLTQLVESVPVYRFHFLHTHQTLASSIDTLENHITRSF